jgi:hypothetical protein
VATIRFLFGDSANTLASIHSEHPLSRCICERITNGAKFPLNPIDDVDRRTDVIAVLARGNHKLARGHEAKLLDMHGKGHSPERVASNSHY